MNERLTGRLQPLKLIRWDPRVRTFVSAKTFGTTETLSTYSTAEISSTGH